MIKLPCPADQWPEFSALLYAALELPIERRAAWLAALPPQQAHMRHWLSDVLRAAVDPADASFLQAPMIPDAPRSEFAPGRHIGPYTLQREIGRGGMGEVWLATRSDGTLSRRVALKLPYAHLLAGALRQRFERERDILASLSHPHIASLYDAGVSDGGHPYLAMEWIEGESITSYCREARTSLQGRLDLFKQVLDAVNYAHTRLIAHRDLKPANILVTRDGQIKLLDFGIAKLLGDDAAGASDLTLLGGRAVTPAYAAPEQLSGQPLTTSVDLYALGVVLFEILSGARPFASGARTEPADAPLVSRRVSEEEAGRVDGLSAARLRKLLQGDLDAIVAKALEPDPANRYRSAEAFAADIARHQTNRPISARRIGRLALAAKFARRHRAASALTVALIAALLLGSAGIAVQAVRLQRESRRAEQAALRAENEARRERATKDFLVNMFKTIDPRSAAGKPRGTITAKELMDVNSARIATEFANDPEIEIELLDTAADIYGLLDESERALQLSRTKLELLRVHRGAASPEYANELIEEADLASSLARFDEAERLLDQADAALKQGGLERTPQRALWLYEKATATIADPSKQAQRILQLNRAVQLYREVAPKDRHLGYALADLGGIYFRRNDLPPALAYERQAIAIAEAEPHPDATHLTALYGNMGKGQIALGELRAAQDSFARAQELVVQTYGPSGRFYWTAISQQARTLHLLGERASAHDLFDRLLKELPTEAAAFHNAEEEVSAARAREAYGTCLLREGRPLAAIPVLTLAEREFAESQQDPSAGLRLRGLLGESYAAAGRVEEARRLLAESVDGFAAKLDADNPTLLKARIPWARFLLERGELSPAEREFNAVLQAARDQNAYYVAFADAGLAQIAMARHDPARAMELARHAVELYDHVSGYRDARMGPYLWRIRADASLLAGDAPGALDWAERALTADRRYDDPASPEIAAAEATRRRAVRLAAESRLK